MTLPEAMRDPKLFGPWFKRDSWNAWRVFLKALFGLAVLKREAALYAQCTGRTVTPTAAAREGWLIVGRRGGKSRVCALIATFLAAFRDYRPYLAPGEVATVAVIAADRKQARTIMRYVAGFFDNVPMLRALVKNRTRESIELTNNVVIEVHTVSFRLTRGYSIAAAICDEVAFWRSDETSANPAEEVLGGLRPGMLTIPGAMLIALSSPYSRQGALWNAYQKHFGKDGDPVVCWQADTATMNPDADRAIIAQAYEDDEAAASAEYGALFRRDLEAFVSREAVAACVVDGRIELSPVDGVRYFGFCDPSGGSQDSMTMAVAHHENGRVILDCVRERKPPFSPEGVTADFAATLKAYRLSQVSGDAYSGQWVRQEFEKHGITYRVSEQPKSAIYGELLPLINAGRERLELLDLPRLIGQLCALERRVGRSGKDSIDHGPRGHDDVINSAAGAAVLAAKAMRDHVDFVLPDLGWRRSPWGDVPRGNAWNI